MVDFDLQLVSLKGEPHMFSNTVMRHVTAKSLLHVVAFFTALAVDIALVLYAFCFSYFMFTAPVTSGSFYTGHIGATIGIYLVVGIFALFASGLLTSHVADWSRDADTTAGMNRAAKGAFRIALSCYLVALVFAAIRLQFALG